jgi:hypothetical protein
LHGRTADHSLGTSFAYAGTVDLVAWQQTHDSIFGWDKAIINIKTGSGVYDTYKLQLAAYTHAFAEMTGYHPNVGFVLHLDLEKGHYHQSCG